MLKGDLLESQSWLGCSPTCAGQGATPNSNLAGASLILYLNLLTHTCQCEILYESLFMFMRTVIKHFSERNTRRDHYVRNEVDVIVIWVKINLAVI